MKRSSSPAPLLERLRRHLRKPLSWRGSQAELAALTGKHRQQIHRWFIKGEGRPTANATLVALRWFNSLPQRKNYGGYCPTWPELVVITRSLMQARGFQAACAQECGVDAGRISRYFAWGAKARQPDGEIALRVWWWFLEIQKMSVEMDAKLRANWGEGHVEKALQLVRQLAERHRRSLKMNREIGH